MIDEAEAMLERLPELLKQRPQLRYRLFEVLSENYSLRAETNRLLDELKAMREESSRRFEAVDRRFEAMREESSRRFEAMDRRLVDMKHSVDIQVGGFTRRAGKGLEEAVAGTLRLALEVNDLDPSTIRMREKVIDDQGMIGPPGRPYEYDILVRNGETWIFEVKSAAEEEDVDRFADKCDLVVAKLKLSHPRRIIVTLAPTPELAAHCRERGVELA